MDRIIRNVLEWLEDTQCRLPEKTAFRDNGAGITFGELLKTARRIGSGLRDIRGKAPIAVLGSRHVSTIAGFLGIVYSGHAYAPLDASMPRYRLDQILSILKPAALAADGENMKLARDVAGGIPVLSLEELAAEEIQEKALQEIRDGMVDTDPLYVIFTSGSTGRPKGVITSHQSLMCYIESYAEVMDIREEDVLGNQSPLDYIAAIRDIYLPLRTGCSTVIIPKEYFMEPNNLFNFMNRHRVTSVGWSVSAFTVPLSLGAFEEVKLETLRKICFSGSVMPAACLMKWQENLPEAVFVNQYGPTETTASCTWYRIDHLVQKDEQLLIGRPYPHYRVFLLNPDLTETPAGEIGEICVSGPILALGYYNDPERTAKSFPLNPNNPGYPERIYRTGDYGRFREDGMLEFHGRKDRQIKHMGHRVELDEIEFAAGQAEGLKECAALYREDTENLYLYYTGEIGKKELLLAMRKILPGFMIPRKVKALECMPKLANGKTDLKALEEDMRDGR